MDGSRKNLMKEFPHKTGDKLPNGISISVVCKGDANDTFGGFLCKEIVKYVDAFPVYGKDVICPTEDNANDLDAHDLRLEVVGPVPWGYSLETKDALGEDGYPKGAKVWFRLPDEKKDRFCTPLEFLGIVAGTKTVVGTEIVDTPEEEAEEEAVREKSLCQGKTQAGEPCKRSANTGEKFCSAHSEE